jgi:hypothetical protein
MKTHRPELHIPSLEAITARDRNQTCLISTWRRLQTVKQKSEHVQVGAVGARPRKIDSRLDAAIVPAGRSTFSQNAWNEIELVMWSSPLTRQVRTEHQAMPHLVKIKRIGNRQCYSRTVVTQHKWGSVKQLTSPVR